MIDSTSLSALSAFSTGINTVANNVYDPTASSSLRTTINEGQNQQSVEAQVQVQEDTAPDYATEFTNAISYERGFEANIKTIQTADQMIGSVLDMKV